MWHGNKIPYVSLKMTTECFFVRNTTNVRWKCIPRLRSVHIQCVICLWDRCNNTTGRQDNSTTALQQQWQHLAARLINATQVYVTPLPGVPFYLFDHRADQLTVYFVDLWRSTINASEAAASACKCAVHHRDRTNEKQKLIKIRPITFPAKLHGTRCVCSAW